MDLASFFTAQAPKGQQGTGTLLTGGQLNAKGGVAAGITASGTSFFDMLLGQASTEQTVAVTDEKTTLGVLQSDNPALSRNPELNIAQLLADNPEIEEQLKDFEGIINLDVLSEIQHALALNQQAFDNTIKPLTDGLITSEATEAGSPRLLNGLLTDDETLNQDLLNKIKSFLANLEKVSEGEKAAELAALNITPAQITSLQDMIAAFEAQLQADANAEMRAQDLEDIQSGFLSILINLTAPQKGFSGTNQSEIAANNANLNAMLAGETAERHRILPQSFGGLTPEGDDFDAIMKELSGSIKGSEGKGALELGNAVKQNNQTANNAAGPPNFSVLNGVPFAFGGSLFTPGSFTQGLGEELGVNMSALQSGSGQALGSISMQAQSAAHPHPATHMVATTMQKSVGKGGNTNITLQLDPPELGRVEVRMQFSKDKTMKAIVTSEKPEAHLMLQRDAHVLEKALQDAGIESDGGLSFELAQDGDFMGGGNERGGAHDQGGTGSGGNGFEGNEIIETTMTWHVDPETGHTRYDIWA